jgi:spermidine synthase
VSFYFYYAMLFSSVLGVLAIPVGLSGATLPLIFHDLRREFGGLGSAAGRIYAWNTIGSLMGALLGGYLLLFWIDLDGVYLLAIAMTILSTGLLVTRWFGWSPAAALVLIPFLLVLSLLPDWSEERLTSGLFRLRQPSIDSYEGPDHLFDRARGEKKIVFYTDDPTSSVAVVETPVPGTRDFDYALFTNGKPDASLHGDYTTMALIALLPTLFVDDPERSFVIGYGSGVTVGELAALDSMKVVKVAEISPGVVEAARFFEGGNQGATANPKTEVIVSDAFRALQRSDERWDIIASEPSNPWVAGIEMLYSREFLEAARDSLNPGGVYSQWMHLYEIDEEVVALVLRTYASVFDHVAVWYTLGTDVVLLGFKDEERALDLNAVHARASRPDVSAGLRRAGIDSFPALLGHELVPVGVLNSVEFSGDIHTLGHPVLNARAAKAHFRGKQAGLPEMLEPPASAIGVRNSLLGRYVQEQGGRLTDEAYAQIAKQTCEVRPILCSTVLASWAKDVPESDLRSRMLERLRADGSTSHYVTRDDLHQLDRLFGVDPSVPERTSLGQARRMTNLYARHFHYGLPFDRDVLAEFWKRCRSGRTVGGCYSERVATDRRLGPVREAKP